MAALEAAVSPSTGGGGAARSPPPAPPGRLAVMRVAMASACSRVRAPTRATTALRAL